MADPKDRQPNSQNNFVRDLLLGFGLVVFVFLLSLGYVFYGSYLARVGSERVERRLRLRLPAREATLVSLSLDPVTKTASLGDSFEVFVKVDTQAEEVSGVDAVIGFDNSVLEVLEVGEGRGFGRYLKEVLNEEGKLYLSAVASPGNPFQGEGDLAVITFGAKGLGKAEVRFAFTPSSEETEDSNVIRAGTDEDVLSVVKSAAYTVVEKAK